MSSAPSSKPVSQNATPSTSRTPSQDRASTSTPQPGNQMAGLEKTPDDQSKFRTFLGILKKFIGVSDLAAVRFSLPAQLMEPIPNLEYWHYLDRPEAFASIGDSDEPLGRMLGALRFWFTKDLKYVKGKPCKPYNSTLGEFFRCNWQIAETMPPPVGNKPPRAPQPASQLINNNNDNVPGSPQSAFYTPSASPTDPSGNPSTTPQMTSDNLPATAPPPSQNTTTVSYFTEQTSHHPPVSAYYIYCPEKAISGRGFDQLAAKFTGTSVRVAPGEFNKGIYVTLHDYDDETYNLTHPIAQLSGLLRGSLNITVADTCYVTCPKSRLKAILHYLEEGWLGKTQNKMVGVIYKYDPNNDTKTRIKDVSDSDIVARVEGCWHERIYFTLGSKAFDKSDKQLLVDLNPLNPMPKDVPPPELQLPNESRKYWADVTNAILGKQWTEAQRAKQEIEDRQRAKKTERDARNAEWQPRFFTGAVTPTGRPELTEEGKAAIEKQHRGDWRLQENAEMAA